MFLTSAGEETPVLGHGIPFPERTQCVILGTGPLPTPPPPWEKSRRPHLSTSDIDLYPRKPGQSEKTHILSRLLPSSFLDGWSAEHKASRSRTNGFLFPWRSAFVLLAATLREASTPAPRPLGSARGLQADHWFTLSRKCVCTVKSW